MCVMLVLCAAGTSIACVYQDSDRMLSNVLRESSMHMQRLIDTLSAILAPSGSVPDTCWVFNSCSFDRIHHVLYGEDDVRSKVGVKGFALAEVPLAAIASSPTPCIVLPGCDALVPCEDDKADIVYLRQLPDGEVEIGNGMLEVVLSAYGSMTSLRDKRTTPHREVLCVPKYSAGNHYVLYDDVPFYWDAWDVMPYHQMTGRSLNGEKKAAHIAVSSKVVRRESRIASIQFTLSNWGETGSCITTTVTILSGSPLIEFRMDVDWHEKHKLLKVEFPLAVRSSVARYETQFGYTERPTHSNQPTDAAMFETCGHKFADLSESGYGVALLNDCKYGYSCRGSTLCMSLLRAPKSPDAACDMGKHTIRYALLPHVGSILEKGAGHDVVRAAMIFNSPLIRSSGSKSISEIGVASASSSADILSFLTAGLCELSGSGGLVVDSMKAAEDCNGSDSPDIIIRLYESIGSRGSTFLYFNTHVTLVTRCTMSEEHVDNLSLEDSCGRRGVRVIYTPFQVITLRVRYL